MWCLYALAVGLALSSAENHRSDHADKVDFYSFSARTIRGDLIDLEEYRGKVSLVVNVASECGFTDGHYKALVRLQTMQELRGRFTVLAFPCNQFGRQEPGSEASILSFAENVYHVNFPMFGKINVIEDNVPPAWQHLIAKAEVVPNWNFYKYLVNYDGQILGAWGPWSDVESITPQIVAAVNEALNAHGPPRPSLAPEEEGHEPYMESGQYSQDSPQPLSEDDRLRKSQFDHGFTAGHDDL